MDNVQKTEYIPLPLDTSKPRIVKWYHVQHFRIIAGALILCCWLAVYDPFKISGKADSLKSSAKIVEEVLMDVPLIDGHNDLPWFTRALYQNHIYNSNFTANSTLRGQVDFPRLRKGRVGGQLWSVFVPCPGQMPYEAGPRTDQDEDKFQDEDYYENIHDTLQQIDLVKRFIKRLPSELVDARSSHDVWRNYAASKRISSLIGVEGLHAIGNSPSALRLYHELGVRYVTLTHFCHNRYADSASVAPYWHGISADGKAMIDEMNRVGMMVDLAHTSADTARQVLDHTNVPLIFSHASSYSICPHPRNVPDDVLWKLKANRGVVMITFLNDYVNCEAPKNATISNVADHIQYVGKLIGYEHVGIGSDYDGMASAPKGLEDVSTYPALLELLADRGVTKQELKGVAGANVLRVLADVEVEAQKREDRQPLEDHVKKIKIPSGM